MIREIYFAGGCFWGTQHYFKMIDGVTATIVGYANGTTPNPTYEDVCTDKTGYAETVKVCYDNAKIDLRFLMEMFFKAINPTSLNKQGEDEGTQYRTGIFYKDNEDKRVIEDFIAEKQKLFTSKILVQVLPLKTFYAAEEYHQDYLDKNPNGYCHLPLELFEMAKNAKPNHR